VNAIFAATIMMNESDIKERWISAACCILFGDD